MNGIDSAALIDRLPIRFSLILALLLGLAVAIGWASTVPTGYIFMLGIGGLVILGMFFRWPTSALVIIYPSTWIFWAISIGSIGRPERIIGVLGIVAALIVMLSPDRVRVPNLPGMVTTGLFLLIGAYLLAGITHPGLAQAPEYLVSLVSRLAFLYLAAFHIRTARQMRLAIGLFVAASLIAGILTTGLTAVYGIGFTRDQLLNTEAEQSLGTSLFAGAASANFGTTVAVFLLFMYSEVRGRLKRILILGLVLYFFLTAFAAQLRREVLITIPLLLLLLAVDKRAGLRRSAIGMLIVSGLVFLSIILPSSLKLQDRLTYETQFIIAGTEPRIASGFAGLQAAANSLLTGYGPGAYAQAVFPILGPGLHGYEYSPYNVFIWILVEAGIFGLLGVVLILFGTFREASRAQNVAGGVEGLVLRSAPALLLLIVIWFTFGNAWELSLPWYLMGVILAAARIADEHRLSEVANAT